MQGKAASAADRKALSQALDSAIRHATGLGVMFSQAVAVRLGLTPTELECLDQIMLGGDVTAGALAEATGLTTGAITGILDRLERADYARRERDPADRRRVLVRVTPTARMRALPYYRAVQRQMAELLDGHGDQEIALLLDYFSRAGAIMQAEIGKLKAERPMRRPPRPRPKKAPRKV